MNTHEEQELHRIAITAIIWRNGLKGREYLISRRSFTKKVHPGKWTVPGGGLQVSDYLSREPTMENQWYGAVEHALRREVREEVGVEVGDVRYLCDIATIRPDGIPLLILSYFCEHLSGEAVCGDDTIEVAWIPAEFAHFCDLIPGIAGEIEMVEAKLDSNNQEGGYK